MTDYIFNEEIFNFYNSFQSPIVNMSFEVEVKDFRNNVRDYGVFQFMLFCICKAIKESDPFMMRYMDGKVYKASRLIPSYTVIRDEGRINFCTFEFVDNVDKFIEISKLEQQKAINSKKLILDDHSHRDYVFITCIPWQKFTSIQNPIGDFSDVSIPCIAIGKIEKVSDDKITFPMSIQAHHGFVDGKHMCDLIEKFKSFLLNRPT